jgi:hypothetical protein
MHDKTDFEICRFQTRDTFVASCGRTSDESGSEIDQIRSTIHHDGCGRSGALPDQVAESQYRGEQFAFWRLLCFALGRRNVM